MHGLLQAGMGNCGKHFPGHGFVKADSHVDIPVDKRSLSAILDEDAAPYPWLSSVLTAVMPAHVIYPRVDARPAGFSEKWLQDILRGQLRYDGAIFSDDLSMEAARRINGSVLSYAEAACAALNAGCDMVLLCNQSVGDGRIVDDFLTDMQRALERDFLVHAAAYGPVQHARMPVGQATHLHCRHIQNSLGFWAGRRAAELGGSFGLRRV